jgi:glycosyltransferase involved in cell wall biosynthesis
LHKDQKHILVLPRWYPNKTDIQLGIFIQNQLQLIAPYFNISVIYVQGIKKVKDRFEIQQSTENGCNEVRVYFQQNKGPFRKLINAYRYLKAQKLGFKALNNVQFELTHVHVPYRSAFLALQLKRKYKIPLLITEHWSGHLNGNYAKKNTIDRFIYKFVLSKAETITTVSEALTNKFKENTGFNAVHLPNLIQKANFPKIPIPDSPLQILSVADLYDKTKNISDLLEAYASFLPYFPNTMLTVIGGGPDENKIRTKTKELAIPKENITLLGRKAHQIVLEAMHNCHFYVCNSNTETFGMTVAEALICGKPVICTTCGGPEEFVNASNGILIPTGDVSSNKASLLTAMLQMTKELKNFDKLKISKEIENAYGEAEVRERWVSLYKSLLK